MKEYLKFLKNKINKIPVKTLFRLEFESLLFGVFSYFPTTLGILIRGVLVKLFLKENKGFAFIQQRVTILHTENISSGKQLGINSGTYLNGIGGIEMGDNVLIGSNVTISSGEHPLIGKYPPIFERATIPKKITIGNDVWLGAGVVVMPGITLANGTVVGANAVVTKNTEEYGVYVGVPAKKIRTRQNIN